jgi:hypothetical protein
MDVNQKFCFIRVTVDTDTEREISGPISPLSTLDRSPQGGWFDVSRGTLWPPRTTRSEAWQLRPVVS